MIGGKEKKWEEFARKRSVLHESATSEFSDTLWIQAFELIMLKNIPVRREIFKIEQTKFFVVFIYIQNPTNAHL